MGVANAMTEACACLMEPIVRKVLQQIVTRDENVRKEVEGDSLIKETKEVELWGNLISIGHVLAE